jgi:hypothetical protein
MRHILSVACPEHRLARYDSFNDEIVNFLEYLAVIDSLLFKHSAKVFQWPLGAVSVEFALILDERIALFVYAVVR